MVRAALVVDSRRRRDAKGVTHAATDAAASVVACLVGRADAVSAELSALVEQAGWTLADLRQVTLTAAHHAFVHEDVRTALIDEIITPGYARAGGGRHQA